MHTPARTRYIYKLHLGEFKLRCAAATSQGEHSQHILFKIARVLLPPYRCKPAVFAFIVPLTMQSWVSPEFRPQRNKTHIKGEIVRHAKFNASSLHERRNSLTVISPMPHPRPAIHTGLTGMPHGPTPPPTFPQRTEGGNDGEGVTGGEREGRIESDWSSEREGG